jgi:hypothetical protein
MPRLIFESELAMTRILLVVLLLVTQGSLTVPRTYDDAERDLKALEAARHEAEIKGKPEVLRRILADDYFGIGSRGETYTKADEISFAGELPNVSIVTDEVVVRLYGDTGIGTGRDALTEQRGARSKRYRYTCVYVRRKGAWQLASYQMTATD